MLVARDEGLRSVLVARLGMMGANILTLETLARLRADGWRDRNVVLVVDQQAADDHAPGIAALAADPRWGRMVLITDRPGEEREGMARVARADAVAMLTQLLPAAIDQEVA